MNLVAHNASDWLNAQEEARTPAWLDDFTRCTRVDRTLFAPKPEVVKCLDCGGPVSQSERDNYGRRCKSCATKRYAKKVCACGNRIEPGWRYSVCRTCHNAVQAERMRKRRAEAKA